MTFGDRVERLTAFEFRQREAAFLVNVMLHAGVCLERQYCTSTGLAHGSATRDFFRRLVARRYATAYRCARRGGHVYHLHARRLYEAIGEPHNRHRRPTTLSRAIERLMVLDAVLAARDVNWLGTEHDKVAHFTIAAPVRRELLPQLVFRGQASRTVRYFPDKLPIGVHPDGRTYEFVYGVGRTAPGDFRLFLYRHAALLRALPRWKVHVIVPPHLHEFAVSFERAAHEELGARLAPKTVEELRWFFRQRQSGRPAAPSDPDHERFRRARRAFGGPRYRVLYRHWLLAGDVVLETLGSPALADAVGRGAGRIQTELVAQPYHYLAPLVGTS